MQLNLFCKEPFTALPGGNQILYNIMVCTHCKSRYEDYVRQNIEHGKIIDIGCLSIFKNISAHHAQNGHKEGQRIDSPLFCLPVKACKSQTYDSVRANQQISLGEIQGIWLASYGKCKTALQRQYKNKSRPP